MYQDVAIALERLIAFYFAATVVFLIIRLVCSKEFSTRPILLPVIGFVLIQGSSFLKATDVSGDFIQVTLLLTVLMMTMYYSTSQMLSLVWPELGE